SIYRTQSPIIQTGDKRIKLVCHNNCFAITYHCGMMLPSSPKRLTPSHHAYQPSGTYKSASAEYAATVVNTTRAPNRSVFPFASETLRESDAKRSWPSTVIICGTYASRDAMNEKPYALPSKTAMPIIIENPTAKIGTLENIKAIMPIRTAARKKHK